MDLTNVPTVELRRLALEAVENADIVSDAGGDPDVVAAFLDVAARALAVLDARRLEERVAPLTLFGDETWWAPPDPDESKP